VTTTAPVEAERARLDALYRYGALDTPREEPFDRLARLAARVLGTPIAAIGLVDAERVWFKAEIGLGAAQVPRYGAICNRTIAGDEPVYELANARTDPGFANDPLLPPEGIGFYAGAALVTPDGFRIGTLCVIDRQKRLALTESQRATLVDLAGAVMTELERRRQQVLGERASARLALINEVLALVGGAAGFVAAMEAAMRRLCAHTGAAFAHLWQQADGAAVRRIASAADPALPAAIVAVAFADLPATAPESAFGPLLAGDVQVLAPCVTEAGLADRPLLLDGFRQGMRAYLFHKLPVGAARYGLLLKFNTERQDLDEVAALLAEVGQAIRPALLRKQAEDRLALLNDVLAVVAGAPNFLAGIERAIGLLCRHVGALAGQFWDRQDQGAKVRLVALAGARELSAALRERAFAPFPLPSERSLLAPVMAAGGRLTMRAIPAAMAAQYPLLRLSVDAGVRGFAAQAFAVGDARYMLVLGFDTDRADLDQVADLLGEMVQAIRPAVLRKHAEDRLTLVTDVLARVAGAAGFREAIEAVLQRLCGHVGAMLGLIWQRADGADELRLVGVQGAATTAPLLRARVNRIFPLPSGSSMLTPLLDAEGQRVVPRLTAPMARRFKLSRLARAAGVRSFVARSLVIGARAYVLAIAFDSERPDLDLVAALMAEIGSAIRPALQRKQAEDQLALLQAAIAATADAVVVTDAATAAPGDHRVVQVNQAFTRMSGYRPEDVLGRNMRFLQGRDTDPAAVRRLRVAVADCRPAREELLNYRRDGSPFWVELDIAPFADERGEVANFVGVLRDTSERRATQEALQRLASQLQERTAALTEVARLARIGFWAWRADGNVMEWSDETYELFGVARATFTPTVDAFFGLLHPEDAQRARIAGWHAIHSGHDLHVEARVPMPGSRIRSIIWSGTARRGDRGTAMELRGYCQDVTERRHAEAALRHGEKLRALGTLTGGIAHEFNNLLTVVQANLEMALDGPGTLAEARPELDAARRAARTGTDLTARLLSFARSEPLRREPTDLAGWLGPLRDMATRTLGQRYPVTLRADPSLPAVAVDRSQLEGAVLNLILNARDAMPAGGPIAIETERMDVLPGARGAAADLPPGGYAVVAVRDRGAGMPAEVAERAFEPFFTTKPAGSGTGLGLSMVLSFARQSGGTVLIESSPGRGTAVRLVLPLG
jgi:PAS domain S-box-containing protein